MTDMKNFIQTIKGISTETLIHQFAEISIDMCKKQEYLHDIDVPIFQGFVRRVMTVKLSAWDIHGIQYHAICNCNDYRNSITDYTIGQIVDLYRQFENEESPAEDLRKADLSGVFKILFGMVSERKYSVNPPDGSRPISLVEVFLCRRVDQEMVCFKFFSSNGRNYGLNV